MYNYGIGGQERKQDASEGITEISQNRTLLLEKLTDDPAIRPEIVGDLKTVDEVFAHFKPEKEVEFESEDGSTYNEMLRFRTLGDFGKRGLINQSAALQELN
ncbi:MAG: hypothetical protein H7Y12_06900, partial [Sphingobacteriaceae bacterium]|nr:hypothetical protein [Cytophagaceae bacterium]